MAGSLADKLEEINWNFDLFDEMFERYNTFPIQPEYRHFAFLYKMDLDPVLKIPSTDWKIMQIILDYINAVFLGKMGRSLNYQYSIELLLDILIKSKMRR